MKENPKNNYSKEEREGFRKIILEKLIKAKEELESIKNELSNAKNNGTDDTSPPIRTFEDCPDTLSKEQIGKRMEQLQKYISGLEKALIRVDTAEYGICRVTGKLIPAERLFLVPHTTLSIEAKQGMEEKK